MTLDRRSFGAKIGFIWKVTCPFIQRGASKYASGACTGRPLVKGDVSMVKRLSIKLPEELHEWLQSDAERRGLTMNAVIIFALESHQMQRQLIPNLSELQKLAEIAERAQNATLIEEPK